MPITITIAAVKAADPFGYGLDRLWKVVGYRYVEDEPIALYVPSPDDVDYVLWLLGRVCGEEGRRLGQRFACDVAEHVLPIFEARYPGGNRPRKAIETTRAWLDGTATDEEQQAAGMAARGSWLAAVDAAVDAAAMAAANAAYWAAVTPEAGLGFVAPRVVVSRAVTAVREKAGPWLKARAEKKERRWQMDRLNELLKE